MATTVLELLTFISNNNVKVTDMIAIDNGGLCLVVYGPDAGLEERKNAANDPATCSAYFEIGGVPVEDEQHPFGCVCADCAGAEL